MSRRVIDNLIKPCDADAWVSIPSPLTLGSLVVALESLVGQLKRLKVTHSADTPVHFATDEVRRLYTVDLKPQEAKRDTDGGSDGG